MTIIRYTASYQNRWNDFLSNAKNHHFFFHRNFLAYHEGRFEDFSLMIFNQKEKLIALLPANIDENILYTHQGLTFGGLIVNDNMKVETMLEIFEALKKYLKEANIRKVIYKAIPHIYQHKGAQEDLYALFIQNATLLQREVSAAIDLRQPVKYSNGRKWSLKKAKKENFTVEESRDFAAFWKLLEEVLQQQHESKPVHTLEEITYLAETFPQNIKLYFAIKEGKIIAGALTFDNPKITKLQYVANSSEGREKGALDYLIDHLIHHVYHNKHYFDFGSSNEENGRYLNRGLIDQKERFGARAVVMDRYEWSLV